MKLSSHLPTQRVTLIKKDGRRIEVSAIVASNVFHIEDMTLPIEDGDTFERRLPSGIVETFIIVDVGYQQGFGSVLPPHYQCKVQNTTAAAMRPSQPHVVYNLIGPNTRVNIQSSDQSTNVVSVESSELFDNLKQAIQQSSLDQALCIKIMERVDAMQASAGTPTFAQTYKEFISIVADHISLVSPFIPALSQLLAS